VIPETKNTMAIGAKIRSSLFIVDARRKTRMSFAIDFDNEPFRMTREIRKIRTDRGLPPEV